MSQKCFITKFPSAVLDNTLPKYGEVELTIFRAVSDGTAILSFNNVVSDIEMTAVNCLISTDNSSYSQSLTLTKSPNWWTSHTIYVKNVVSGTSKLVFGGKYTNDLSSPSSNLKAYKGEDFIGAIRYSQNQRQVVYTNNIFADGLDYALDLSVLRGSIYTSLSFYGNTSATGTLASLQTSALSSVDVRRCVGITIPIAALLLQTQLKTLRIDDDGDSVPTIDWTLSQLAELAVLDRVELFSIENGWSSSSLKASSTHVWGGIFNLATSTDVDNFLINMANCQVGSYKTIIINGGSRTSASDSAVISLKASGYTIKINGTNQ